MERKIRVFSLAVIDAILINIAYFIANYIRFDGIIEEKYLDIFIDNFIVVTVIKLGVFAYFKLYRSLWRYASIDELIQIVISVAISNTMMVSYLLLKQVNLAEFLFICYYHDYELILYKTL